MWIFINGYREYASIRKPLIVKGDGCLLPFIRQIGKQRATSDTGYHLQPSPMTKDHTTDSISVVTYSVCWLFAVAPDEAGQPGVFHIMRRCLFTADSKNT